MITITRRLAPPADAEPRRTRMVRTRWARSAIGAGLALSLAPSAWGHTYTLYPVADTYVRQAVPNASYGSSGTLRIRNNANGQGEYTFMRFDLPNLVGSVTASALTQRVTGTIHEVGSYAVNMGNPNWSEGSLTWNNWITGSSFTYLGSQHNLSPGSTLNVNVTGWLNGSSVTFAHASGFDVGGQRFSSKEGGTTPILTIVTNGTLAKCKGPVDSVAELDSVVRTGNLLYGCDYKKNLSPTFGAWAGGSENLPVITAAVALFDGPVVNGTDYRVWWRDFFDKQASTSGSGHVNFFKGSELFSNVYDASTTVGVIAARYWAHLNGDSAILSRSSDYLKRTLYAWSLAASPQYFDGIYRNQGSVRTFVEGRAGSCPTLALASPRSWLGYGADSKRWLLATILGYNPYCYKFLHHKPLVDHILARYGSASGLTNSERNGLRALINSTVLPSNLGAVLGAVRMERDYHFILWSDGRRATYYVGHQLNNNISFGGNKHTIFASQFNRGTRDVDLLFIEGRNNVSCVQASTNQIIAKGPGVTSCSSNNSMTLPSNPTHHFVLGPTGWRSCSSLSC